MTSSMTQYLVPTGDGGAHDRCGPHRDALDDERARREGHRRGRHDRLAARRRERRRRRGLPPRGHHIDKPASPERVWRAIQDATSRREVRHDPGCRSTTRGRSRSTTRSSCWAARDDAKLLAGGHSLLPPMKLRLAQPSRSSTSARIGDLSYVREDGDEIAIGALTRHHDVANSEVLQQACADRGRHRAADRRPAGAPRRHDRRLDRARATPPATWAR